MKKLLSIAILTAITLCLSMIAQAQDDQDKNDNNSKESCGVRWAESGNQEQRERASRKKRERKADERACAAQQEAVPAHHVENPDWRRTERHPNANLAGAARNGIQDDSIKPNRCQRQTQHAHRPQ